MRKPEEYLFLPYETQVVPEECTDGTTCYRAFHPRLPGCMSHGGTPQEAIENLAEARKLVIEHLLDTDQEIPQPITSAPHGNQAPTAIVWTVLPSSTRTCESSALVSVLLPTMLVRN